MDLSRIYLEVRYPAAIGYGVTKVITLASKGGDQEKKAGRLRNEA
jgi:hypothetical protein